MCKRCIIFTYDEVLDIVMKIEVGAPLNFNPDWPVRTTEAYPKSVAPLIVPKFDTATAVPTSTLSAESSNASLPTFAPGSLEVREFSWGFEESWKPGVVFNTRIESATKPTWQESFFPFLPSSRRTGRKPTPRPKRESPSSVNMNSVFLDRR